LQIVIDWDPKLMGDGWMKGDLFGAVKDRLDPVTLQPIAVECYFPSSNPDAGYDLVNILACFSVVFHYEGG
jgi:hypothetical protein